MSALCPVCSKLVAIRVAHVLPNGRYVYRPQAHDGDGQICYGREIR